MASKSHNRSSKKSSKFMIKKSLSKGYNVAKSATKKYAPKVKAGLKTVGSTVKVVAKKTVPVIEKVTNKLLGFFNKTRRNLKMKSKA
jgi:hypothetical protein